MRERAWLATPQHVAEQKVRRGEYLCLQDLFYLIDTPYNSSVSKLFMDHFHRISSAKGSSKNHQAWEGGYLDHVVETMNIAAQMYVRFDDLRGLPFSLSDTLIVMFLHDLEKPWKYVPHTPDTCLCGCPQSDHTRKNPWSEVACRNCSDYPRNCNEFRHVELKTKQDRRAFRDGLVVVYDIRLTEEQLNALRYVEGVPDSEYTPHERTMGELAAFCHCCDILSARLWHDWGKEDSWHREQQKSAKQS